MFVVADAVLFSVASVSLSFYYCEKESKFCVCFLTLDVSMYAVGACANVNFNVVFTQSVFYG